MRHVGHPCCLLLMIFLLGLFLFTPPLSAAEDTFGAPWDSLHHRYLTQRQKPSQRSTSIASPFFTSLLTFFSKAISPVDGNRCPSYPTCAAYSKEAYQEHGAFMGTLMTVDRLFHEADEVDFSPIVRVYGVNRIYDPVSANEVWKRKEKRQAEARSTPPEK